MQPVVLNKSWKLEPHIQRYFGSEQRLEANGDNTNRDQSIRRRCNLSGQHQSQWRRNINVVRMGPTNALGNVTPKQPIASGSTLLPVAASISGLSSNSTYYFRIDASNSAGTSTGNILPLTTLSTLPAPVLLTPQNAATNVSTAPLFSWTAVSNATSYRIMVATTSAALPRDPTLSTCGAGCLIDVTPIGTTYTPPAGILTAGTQYFWQVHARSPLQYGDWSSVSSFTAGQSSISSLSISPSSNVASGSSTTLTVTLSGPAPSGGAVVTLSSNNSTAYPVPASITVQAGKPVGERRCTGRFCEHLHASYGYRKL